MYGLLDWMQLLVCGNHSDDLGGVSLLNKLKSSAASSFLWPEFLFADKQISTLLNGFQSKIPRYQIFRKGGMLFPFPYHMGCIWLDLCNNLDDKSRTTQVANRNSILVKLKSLEWDLRFVNIWTVRCSIPLPTWRYLTQSHL